MTQLEKFIDILKAHRTAVKRSYLLVIGALLLFAFINIYHQVHFADIARILAHLSPQRFGLLIGCGILALLPMSIYDVIYTQKIDPKINKFTLLKNSFIINTFTNSIGGGGMIGASLRSYLFQNKTRQANPTLLKLVAQIGLFTMVGLAINTMFSLILNINSLMNLPSLMKIILSAFPFYVAVPFIIQTSFKVKDYVWLVIGSTLEWACAISLFIIIGKFLHVTATINQIYLAVIYAGIIGAISLIPGGLGSFDSVIIVTLHALNVPINVIVLWDLIYRICYYFVPLLISCILFLTTYLIKYVKRNNNVNDRN